MLICVWMRVAVATAAQERIEKIDELVDAVAAEIVERLDPRRESVIAVYYFTINGEQSGVSDYLINGLTTRIANLGRDRVRIVTRQVLDRIVEEYTFQVSDLADRKTQLRIGGQLGANLLLTGFITPASGYFKLNVQLIEVRTGVVRGGFIVDFNLEPEFENLIRSGTASVSEVVTTAQTPVAASGVATRTMILETFDSGTSRFPIDYQSDAWGDRVASASGRIGLDDMAGRDGSACVRLSFEARLQGSERIQGWQESDVYHYLNLKITEPPGDADGLHFSLKPLGFSEIVLLLKQRAGDEESYFELVCQLNPDEWQDLKIPFYNFYPEEKGAEIDPRKSLSLTIGIPYRDNFRRYHFRTGDRMQGALLVDNFGYFAFKSSDDESVLDSFDDEVSRIVFYCGVYRSNTYTDYSDSDEGVEKKTPGIRDQRLAIRRKARGTDGSFLSILSSLRVTEELRSFIDAEQALGFYLKAVVGKSWLGWKAISFSLRSDLLGAGSFEVHDADGDVYYYYDIGVNPIWTRVRIPFEQLVSEDGSLAESGSTLEHVYLSFFFDLPQQAVIQALAGGELDFSFDLDDFVLE